MRIRNFLEIDFFIFFAVMALVVIGILFIYSSGITSEGIQISTEYRRQIVWASVGLIIALFIAMQNYRRVYDLSLYFYLGSLILLLYTFIAGRVFNGSRWLRIGSFGIQISEFSKITLILFLAWYLDSTRRNQRPFVRFIVSCAIALVPMLIVLIQPDLGTALVFIPILLGMAYVAGIHPRYIIFSGLFIIFSGLLLVLPLWQTYIMNNAFPALMMLVNTRFVAACALILALVTLISAFGLARYHKRYFYWVCYAGLLLIFSLSVSFIAHKVLKEYQIMRLIVFVDPNVDPQGSGWHIIQSVTAIGSGGVFGKGYLQGTQSHYRFLPEQSTDFIFSILSEEWGFIGGISVFALFLIVLFRLIRIMRLTSDFFASYIVAGLISMYAFHFVVNVGMTMGIMPITGIPLMFVSYGGSALIASMLGIGLASSIYVRRYLHQ
jgi:rod shape determining protein RodA